VATLPARALLMLELSKSSNTETPIRPAVSHEQRLPEN
jgi:hypothetical protein